MKAIVYKQYGSPDVLQLKDIEKPVPGPGEVLVKVHAASINSYDWRHVRADPFLVRLSGVGLFSPKHPVPGGDVAGTVEKVGSDVKGFRSGDSVFGGNTFGGFAEYVCLPEKCLALKPDSFTYEQAASMPSAAITALQALRLNGQADRGQRILINGASGGVGTYAVQLAKYFGAHVTGVCSTSKMDLVKAMGADAVIDYKHTDVTKCNSTFDRVIDIAAYRSPLHYKPVLAPQGQYIMIGGATSRIFQLLLLNMLGRRNMRIMLAKLNQDDLLFLKELAENGHIQPAIDKVYPLAQVREAMWYFERGFTRGKIAITVSNPKS